MISIFLSATVLLSITLVYLGVKNHYREQEYMISLQENGRLASYILTKNIREAGYAGCFSKNLKDKIHGFTSTNLPDYLIDKGVVPGTDIIEIKKADFGITHLTKNVTKATYNITVEHNPATENNLWLWISDCTNADLVGAQNYIGNNIKLNKKLTHPYQITDTEVAEYTEITYFIGNTSYKDDYGKPINALYEIINGNKNPMAHKEELISGIENMQIMYGLDLRGDGTISNYYKANQVSDWNNVRSVSIILSLEVGKGKSKEWPLYIALREV